MESVVFYPPVWVNALITLGVALAGGTIICVLFALGMKHGIEAGSKKRKSRNKKEVNRDGL